MSPTTSARPIRRSSLDRSLRGLLREVRYSVRHLLGCQKARRVNFQGQKLNLGCGKYLIPGWINADLYRHADAMFDIRARWPIQDGQLVGVRLEHVLEHVAYPDEALHVLAECYRVLTPGGTVRVGVPDSEKAIWAYVEGDNAQYFRVARERWHPPEIQLPIEHLNYHFRDRFGEHLFAYDRQSLSNLLHTAGFIGITTAPFDPAFDRADREEGTLRLSGTKPSQQEPPQ
jgi:predicted SAM-dependent methyltransferase